MDVAVEDFGVSSALSFGLVFTVHESAELVHLGMNGLECGVLIEEFLKLTLLSGCKSRRSFAHGDESAAVVFEFWGHCSGEGHEVMVDEAHDMETVGDDPGIGKEAADDIAVGAGEIDTDDSDLVPSS